MKTSELVLLTLGSFLIAIDALLSIVQIIYSMLKYKPLNTRELILSATALRLKTTLGLILVGIGALMAMIGRAVSN